MTTKLLLLLFLLGVRNFLRQHCREKLNFSWKRDQSALRKNLCANLTRFLFLLPTEKLVASQMINVIRRVGFGLVLAGEQKVDNLQPGTFILAKELLTWLK